MRSICQTTGLAMSILLIASGCSPQPAPSTPKSSGPAQIGLVPGPDTPNADTSAEGTRSATRAAQVTAPPTSEEVDYHEFSAKFDDTSTPRRLVVLFRGLGDTLNDVDVVFTLYRDDGQKLDVKRHLSSWSKGEEKVVDVQPHPYQKVEIKGTAKRSGKAVVIDTTWKFAWKSK